MIQRKILDQVLITYFLKAYTGEETCEISCHGNPLIVSSIIHCLIKTGFVRMARPGEFTYRAFLNSKIDLTQAEGILSLVHARSTAAKEQALLQLRGELKEKLLKLKEKLIELLSDIEAAIDFSHEEIDIISYEKITQTIEEILHPILKLLNTYKAAKLLNSGLRIPIVGRVNVGKSSLINKLLSDEKAIVSNVEGTTRDAIEGNIIIKNLMVTFIDTAGFRKTLDDIENLGLKKTHKAIDASDVVIFVTDKAMTTKKDKEILAQIKQPTIIVNNKSDIWGIDSNTDGISISIKNDTGIEDLKTTIQSKIENQLVEDSIIITQLRQAEVLEKISENLKKAKALSIKNESLEFVTIEVRLALNGVLELLGLEFNDEIMDTLFSKFCIGK